MFWYRNVPRTVKLFCQFGVLVIFLWFQNMIYSMRSECVMWFHFVKFEKNSLSFIGMMSCHSITHISVSVFVSYIPVNLKLKVLPKHRRSASYFDILFDIFTDGRLLAWIYDEHDDFKFLFSAFISHQWHYLCAIIQLTIVHVHATCIFGLQ